MGALLDAWLLCLAVTLMGLSAVDLASVAGSRGEASAERKLYFSERQLDPGGRGRCFPRTRPGRELPRIQQLEMSRGRSSLPHPSALAHVLNILLDQSAQPPVTTGRVDVLENVNVQVLNVDRCRDRCE